MLRILFTFVVLSTACRNECRQQADNDGDGVADICDNCPFVPNESQSDADLDGYGDACSCEAAPEPCVDGLAGIYPCRDVDFAARVPLSAFGGATGNDMWGWTDPESGREIAIVGMNHGTGFLDLSNPECPAPIAFLPTASRDSVWRDVETYASYAYVGSEANDHDIQIVDLRRLPLGAGPAVVLEPDATLAGVGGSHTLTIEPETGLLAINGGDLCEGLQLVDLADPLVPTLGGCLTDAGVTHDAQCTLYRGPDPDHVGITLCMVATGWSRALSLVDATDVMQPFEISRFDYGAAAEAAGGAPSAYAHQGWLTDDHRTFLLGDELDEIESAVRTRTFLIDVEDLDAPALLGTFRAATGAIDHQIYVAHGLLTQSNYTAGLRILDLAEVRDGILTEQAFFDIYPPNDAREFIGAWGHYPWFDSGVIPVNDVLGNVFVLRPRYSM